MEGGGNASSLLQSVDHYCSSKALRLRRGPEEAWCHLMPRGNFWLEIPGDSLEERRLLKLGSLDSSCPFFPCVPKQCPADGVWRIGRGGSPDRVLKTRFTPSESSAGHGLPPQRAPKQCPANGVRRVLWGFVSRQGLLDTVKKHMVFLSNNSIWGQRRYELKCSKCYDRKAKTAFRTSKCCNR